MSLFTRLNVISSDTSLPTLSPEDVRSLVPFEESAYAHWIFDKGDSRVLTSVTNDKTLTLQNNPPIYSQNHIRMATSRQNALFTDVSDTADAVDTMCVVFRPRNIDILSVLCGSFADAGVGTGYSPYITNGNLGLNARGTDNSFSGGGPSSFVYEGKLSNDLWFFFAVSRDFTGGNVKITRFLGGLEPIEQQTTSGDQSYSPTDGNLALGQAYFTGGAAQNDFAEFILFDRYVGGVEMAEIFGRSKARMQQRGIQITEPV